MILYQLVLTDVETENCFDIGVYSTAKKAKETAEYYQKHIPGFMSYPCKKEVFERPCFGEVHDGIIYAVIAWNESSNRDEVDMVQSDFFATENGAKLEMEKLKKQYTRSFWMVSKSWIDRRQWQEGISRYAWVPGK